MERLAQVMTREVEVVDPGTELREVVRVMGGQQLSCVVVVSDERPVGMITERDLVRALDRLLGGDSAGSMRVAADVMTQPVSSVSMGMSCVEALDLIDSRQVRRLPVVDDSGCLVGLVTHADLLRAKQRLMQAQRDNLELVVAERTRTLAAERDEAMMAVQENMEFLATMTHEIRTPLNGVVGMAELLHDTTLSAQQREWVSTIGSCGRSLGALVNDILDFAKMEATKLELEALPFSLQQLTEEVGDLLALKAQGKHVELRLHFDVGSHDLVVGDPGRLRQVVTNLCGNAIKFTDHGEVVVTVSLTPLSEARGQLQVAVRDTGIGISLEQQKRLFQAYTQADPSISRRFGGTGLGLAISKRLVEAMGGRMAVCSEPGVGSTFSFGFEVGLGKGEDEYGQLANSGLRALVVDEHPTTNEDLCAALHRLGVQAHGVQNVVEASACLARGDSYQMAFVRFPLTERAHRKVLESLPHRQPRIHVFLVTAIAEHALALGVAHHGYAGTLTRPVKRRPLHDAVLGVMRRSSVQPGASASHAESAERAARARVRLLLAEDNKINQMVFVQQLRRIGYECVVVVDGQEAVDAFRARSWDLVLMDYRMPRLNGVEAAVAIREFEQEQGRPRTPIVALTAAEGDDDRKRCLEAGMDAFLTKPIHIDMLDEVVQAQLRTASPTALSPILLDGIAELMNIGVGRGAAELGEMMGLSVQLTVPSVAVVSDASLPQLPQQFDRGLWSAVHLGFDGPFQGSAALMFAEAGAGSLVSVLEADERTRRVLDGRSERTLIEVGNIVLNSVVGSFSNILTQAVNFEVPYYQQGTVARLMANEHYFGANTTLLARTHLTVRELSMDGVILVVLGLRSFEAVLERLNQLMAEGEGEGVGAQPVAM